MILNEIKKDFDTLIYTLKWFILPFENIYISEFEKNKFTEEFIKIRKREAEEEMYKYMTNMGAIPNNINKFVNNAELLDNDTRKKFYEYCKKEFADCKESYQRIIDSQKKGHYEPLIDFNEGNEVHKKIIHLFFDGLEKGIDKIAPYKHEMMTGFESGKSVEKLELIHFDMVEQKYIEPNEETFINVFIGKAFEFKKPIVWTLYNGTTPNKTALNSFLKKMLPNINVISVVNIPKIEKIFVDKKGAGIKLNKDSDYRVPFDKKSFDSIIK